MFKGFPSPWNCSVSPVVLPLVHHLFAVFLSLLFIPSFISFPPDAENWRILGLQKTHMNLIAYQIPKQIPLLPHLLPFRCRELEFSLGCKKPICESFSPFRSPNHILLLPHLLSVQMQRSDSATVAATSPSTGQGASTTPRKTRRPAFATSMTWCWASWSCSSTSHACSTSILTCTTATEWKKPSTSPTGAF